MATGPTTNRSLGGSLKCVPWFSVKEWHEVYKQIYSNDLVEQTKAYQTLLVWKARISKLPAGVECTFLVLQVCLKDREWVEKDVSPLNYENDLQLFYSSTIMRTLNHIFNMENKNKQQQSLFQIAKQLKVPEWIVNLRHDIAHGHNLPSITLMRIAANFLLAWLHNEYWVIEAKNIEQEILENHNSTETDITKDLIEIWIISGVYIFVGYNLVSEVPDLELREMLVDLSGSSELEETRETLLLEISRKLRFSSQRETLIDAILNSPLFLLNKESQNIFLPAGISSVSQDLPLEFIKFWENLLQVLYANKMLTNFVKKLYEISKSSRETNKCLFANMWIRCLLKSLLKLKLAISASTEIEKRNFAKNSRNLDYIDFLTEIREFLDKKHPEYVNCLWFDSFTNFNNIEENLLREIVLDPEFSQKNLVLELLELPIREKEKLEKLVSIMEGVSIDSTTAVDDEIHTTEDLNSRKNVDFKIFDTTARNSKLWTSTEGNHEWMENPIGVLPWQENTLDYLQPLKNTMKKVYLKLAGPQVEIVAGRIEMDELKMRSDINWREVFKSKKRKHESERQTEKSCIVSKAMEIVKRKKQ